MFSARALQRRPVTFTVLTTLFLSKVVTIELTGYGCYSGGRQEKECVSWLNRLKLEIELNSYLPSIWVWSCLKSIMSNFILVWSLAIDSSPGKRPLAPASPAAGLETKAFNSSWTLMGVS